MREISYIQAINEALREEMEQDEKVFIIGESIQSHLFFVTEGLVEKFGPERVMDATIAETALAGASVGSSWSIRRSTWPTMVYRTSAHHITPRCN